MQDVITIGAATRDVFLISDAFIALKSHQFPTGIGECVALGSKIELEQIVLTTGGGATNAAATFSTLGFKTSIVSKIGDDAPGRDVLDDLKRFGINRSLIRIVKNASTAYSTLLTMKQTGERTILVHRGVSAKFSPQDINWDKCKSKWMYLTSLGGNLALSKRIINHGAGCGTKIMWNPGSKELKQGLSKFKSVLKHVDILNMNKEEAMMMTGKKTIKKSLTDLHRPGKITIITDGKAGSYIDHDGKGIFVGTSKSNGISRTGAGDAFGSAFASAFIKTGDAASAGIIGTLNAESVIKKHGAKNGILSKWPTKATMKKIKTSSL